MIGWQFDMSPDYPRTSDAFFCPLQYEISDYFGCNSFLERETARIVSGMTADEKIGQLLMPAWEKNTTSTEIKRWIDEYHLGGFMPLRNDLQPADTVELIRHYESLDKSHSLPIFAAIDAEPSLLQYRLPGRYDITTESLKSEQAAKESGQQIAGIVSEFGFNLNFAPVYDSNENRSVIGDRSFGPGNDEIAPLAAAFVDGQQEKNILTTAKHFPGHGSVVGDTHISLQTVSSDVPELDQFKTAIENQTPFMMVGHLAINGGRYDTSGYPATLSRKVSTDLLRDELGFTGITITDGLNMGALNQFGSDSNSIDEQALLAGADVLLIPRTLDLTYSNLLQKIQTDPEFENIVNIKLNRIVRMKLVWQWSQNN